MKFLRRSLLAFALALSVARCADQPTAVPAPAVQVPTGPQFLRWAETPQFTARTDAHPRRSGTIAQTPPLSLDQYVVSFWAVRGESRSIRINYSSSIDNDTHPFLMLTATDPRFVPGVGEVAVGDSVLITVSVDTSKIGVSLEPSGLQFGEPAKLQIWYGGAAGDMNGDGVSDSTDAKIEAQLLGLWYREGEADQWTQVGASQSLEEKSFTYALPHFCEYAVAGLVADLVIDW
ncbi:MAG TPA: hypothetical protein VGQ29_02495 [Gemmatimonadales bacterium]|nr:hypothetical protein [Gemmatimonadales bacterium]